MAQLAEALAHEVYRHVSNRSSMQATFAPADLVKVVQAYARMQLADGGCCPRPLIHMQPVIHVSKVVQASARMQPADGWVLPTAANTHALLHTEVAGVASVRPNADCCRRWCSRRRSSGYISTACASPYVLLAAVVRLYDSTSAAHGVHASGHPAGWVPERTFTLPSHACMAGCGEKMHNACTRANLHNVGGRRLY